eukprot:CFRG6980T1
MGKLQRIGPNKSKKLNLGTSKPQLPATDENRLCFDPESGDIEVEVVKRDGCRIVKPYYYVYRAFTKGRWCGETLIDTLNEEFKAGTDEYYRTAIRERRIGINERKTTPEYKLKQGDRLVHWIHRHEPPVTEQEVSIVHEDDDVVVVNKPASIPVHPCGRYRMNTISGIMGLEHNLPDLGVVHRLDRLTSGILILGKDTQTAAKYSEWIRDRDVQKVYLARVRGVFPLDPCEVDMPTDTVLKRMGVCGVSPTGKPALTKFELVHTDGSTSVVKCMPRTGRQHQIRVHLQYLGYPICNDPIYAHQAWGSHKGEELKLPEVLARVDKALLDGVLSNDAPHELFKEPAATSTIITEGGTCTGLPIPTSTTTPASMDKEESTTISKATGKPETDSLATNGTFFTADIQTKEAARLALKNKNMSVHCINEEKNGATAKSNTKSMPENGLTSNNRLQEQETASSTTITTDESADPTQHSEDIRNASMETMKYQCDGASKRQHSPTRHDNVGSQKKYKKTYQLADTNMDDNLDPYCGECRIIRSLPEPASQILYLHAYTYSGEHFNYATPMPEWADESFDCPYKYPKEEENLAMLM